MLPESNSPRISHTSITFSYSDDSIIKNFKETPGKNKPSVPVKSHIQEKKTNEIPKTTYMDDTGIIEDLFENSIELPNNSDNDQEYTLPKNITFISPKPRNENNVVDLKTRKESRKRSEHNDESCCTAFCPDVILRPKESCSNLARGSAKMLRNCCDKEWWSRNYCDVLWIGFCCTFWLTFVSMPIWVKGGGSPDPYGNGTNPDTYGNGSAPVEMRFR